MKRLLGNALLTTALLIPALCGRTQSTVFEYSVDVSVNNAVDTLHITDNLDAPIDLTAEETGVGFARGRAFVGHGVNKALAKMSLPDPNNPAFLAYSLATAAWWDQVTISDPALNGTPGTFTTTMLVNGSGFLNASQSWVESFDMDVYARWLVKVSVYLQDGTWEENNWYGGWEKDWEGTSIQYFGDPLNSFQAEISLPFIYGEPFALGGLLQSYISLDNYWEFVPGTLESELDLGNSAYWAGITSIKDRNGNRVTSATLTSRSGTNWLERQYSLLSGTVTLEGVTIPATPQQITLEFRPQDNSPLFTETVTVGANGSFQLPAVPRKSYLVWIKGARWLAEAIPVAAAAGDVSNITVTLRAGDANNDNSADVLDLDLLLQAFDTGPVYPNWNAGADFNADNSVDVLDLDLLLRNFDATGAL